MAIAKVEIGSDPTQEDLAKWYEKHKIQPDADGSFAGHSPEGSVPVGEEGILEQVRVNAERHDIPNLRGYAFREQTMVFVAGGPSLNNFVDEIKAKCANPSYDVYTSNKTCSWMISKGMKPKYHVILDPTERKKLDLEYEDHEGITAVLGLQCHPAVFEKAKEKGQKVVKFLAASATRDGVSDVDVARAAITEQDPELIGIGGGSMTGTRMIYLAAALGYRKLEYYGFDGSIEYDPATRVVKHYAYSKPRGEYVLTVTAADGKEFYSTAALSKQADEIVRLMDNLPGLEVVVHGDGFLAHQVALYKDRNEPAPYRMSEGYRKLQEKLHDDHAGYGTSGRNHASRVFMAGAQIVRKFGKCDILDYGCGKETLRLAVEEAFPPIEGMRILGYDPGRPGFDAEPSKAQVVVCTDVMEHIEPECVDAVLRHICELTEHVAIINVSLVPAVKTLADGRNAHICLKPKEWWISFLKKYFVLIEQADSPAELLVVGQPITRWIERQKKA